MSGELTGVRGERGLSGWFRAPRTTLWKLAATVVLAVIIFAGAALVITVMPPGIDARESYERGRVLAQFILGAWALGLILVWSRPKP